MRLPLVAAALVLSVPSTAQLLERNAQASWMSSSEHVVRWNDSLWAFAGNVSYLGSTLSGTVTTAIDTTGVLKWEIPVLAPGNDGLYASSLAPLNDSVLLVGGWTREVCDAGGDHGFLMSQGLNGDPLWSRSFGLQPLEHLATPGHAILAGSGDQVVVLDLSGDSLALVTLPFGATRRLRTNDTLALAACDSGALVLDTSSSVVLSRPFIAGVDDLVRYNDSSYACLSGGWLYLLDSALAPTDSVDYGDVGPNASLHEDHTYLWVIGGDTARFFDPALGPVLAFPMAAPAGHFLTDASIGVDVIMTSGSFQDGAIRTAVQRSVGKHGEIFDVPVDAALGDVSADDIVITPGLPGEYGVDVALRVWVRNAGGEVLNGAFLDLLTSGAPCGPVGVINQTGLGLLPGDSVLAVLAGAFATVVSPDSTPVDVEFCIRVTTPNDFMDRDTSNNYSCGTITIPIGIPESEARSALFVFPDPATDHLNILLPPGLGPIRYRILDQVGREVRSGTIANPTVDLTGLHDGSYLLLIDDHAGAARFVKLP